MDDLAARVLDGARTLDKLGSLYRTEVEHAQWTRRGGAPSASSSPGHGDPTAAVASLDHRERRAKAIAADISYVVDQLEQAVRRHSPPGT